MSNVDKLNEKLDTLSAGTNIISEDVEKDAIAVVEKIIGKKHSKVTKSGKFIKVYVIREQLELDTFDMQKLLNERAFIAVQFFPDDKEAVFLFRDVKLKEDAFLEEKDYYYLVAPGEGIIFGDFDKKVVSQEMKDLKDSGGYGKMSIIKGVESGSAKINKEYQKA